MTRQKLEELKSYLNERIGVLNASEQTKYQSLLGECFESLPQKELTDEVIDEMFPIQDNYTVGWETITDRNNYFKRVGAKWLRSKQNTKPSVYKIVTNHIYPPIPKRDYDWEATRKSYDEGDFIGYGKTEQDAIDNLLELESETQSKEQQTSKPNKVNECKILEINFNGYVQAQISVEDNTIKVIRAMDGYGKNINITDIEISDIDIELILPPPKP